MPELVLFCRGEVRLRVVLERERLVIGSGQNSDIILSDPHLSPRHVALVHDGTRCMLEDLSGQGIRVAGQPMKYGELVDGVDIALGQWVALFRQSTSTRADRPGPRTDVQHRDALKEGPSPAQLRIKQGTTELLYDIGTEPFTLGSAPDNTLVVQDKFISQHHLQVTRFGERFHVRDLSSTNGTYLGELRLFEAELPLNTVLRMGDTELIFERPSQASQQPALHGILGNEPAVLELLELIQRAAHSSASVLLLLGESGTGKELVARALHYGSPRSAGHFIPINCAALSPALLESELFGHTQGAFTGATTPRRGAFEEAQGGTLFLDEVGELPLELQAKLLRVLENGEVKPVGANRPFRVDVRVVAATHRELPALVRAGKFREDLYYRLCVLPLVLPPLRSRRADIRLLAEHFLRLHEPSEVEMRFTSAALARLQQHLWPGNVRELRNVVCRALSERKGLEIDAHHITFEPRLYPAPQAAGAVALELPEGLTLEQMLQRLERQLIENTLLRCDNNKEHAARRLGLARSSLFKRLKAWGGGAE